MARALYKLLLVAAVVALILGDAGLTPAQQNVAAPESQPNETPSEAVLAGATGSEESPLLVEPKTPEELFDAALLMVKLARLKLARQYLEGFIKTQPDDDLLLKLRDEHPAGVFLRLAGIKELQPLSTQLLERVNAAFRRQAVDPKRIDGLIADLSGSPREREVAVVSLKNTGPMVVPRILTHLGRSAQAQQRDLLLYTLTRLGSQAVPPLLGALETPDPNLQSAAIEALGWLGARDAVPHLLYPAYAENQPAGVQTAAREALARILKGSGDKVHELTAYGAAEKLKTTALEHFRGDYPWPREKGTQNGDTVTLWSWEPKAETIAAKSVTPETASLEVGTRLARQALALAPERRDIQALFLGLSLASDVHQAGWGRPLLTGPGTAHDLALTAGREAVTRTLALALQERNTAASVAALQVLAQIGTRDELTNPQSRQAPLRAALNFPDRRVQFAAARAVLELDPVEPFPGAGRVVEILARALNDGGKAAAIVADPNVERGRQIAGQLEDMGYKTTPVPTGQDAFRAAAHSGDVELILLHVNCIRWGLSQTVANLRADARTAALPIAVYGPESVRPSLATVLHDDPLTTYVVEATATDYLSRQLRPFLKEHQSPPLTSQQRSERRKAAAFWLAHIAHGRRTDLFNLLPAEDALIAAVQNPDTADNVLLALSVIPTQAVQQQLQETAVNKTQSADVRELAALHLAFHIRRFGLLLSDRQVGEIRASWQAASEPALSTALAAVIGSLKPNETKVGARLRRFSPVAPPAGP